MGHNQLLEKIDMNRVEKCYCARIVYVCVRPQWRMYFLQGMETKSSKFTAPAQSIGLIGLN